MVDWLERLGHVHYRGLLETAIEWRYAVIVGAIGVLVLSGAMMQSGRLRYQFFPQVEGNVAFATLTMQDRKSVG